MRHYVGLDVSMKATSICIVNECGAVIYEGIEQSDPVLLAKHLNDRNLILEKVALESGSISNWLVSELVKLGIPAICVDARHMAAVLSVQINKTDRNDAKGIAQALRSSFYREVKGKSEAQIGIGVLLTSRKALVRQRTTLKNTVRGILKAYGIRVSETKKKDFVQQTLAVAESKNPDLKRSVEALLVTLEMLNVQISGLEERLQEIAKADKDIGLLTTIPGVGLITALSYKVSIGDPERFKNSRSVAAYLGLTPKQYSSGEIEKQGRISKYGDTETRSLLVEAATVMLTRVKVWSKPKAWGLKLMRKKGIKKATVAMARKLAVIMHRMLITKKPFVLGDSEEKQDRKAA